MFLRKYETRVTYNGPRPSDPANPHSTNFLRELMFMARCLKERIVHRELPMPGRDQQLPDSVIDHARATWPDLARRNVSPPRR